MIRRSIRLTFGAKAQPGITLQRGDCFSTAICAQCYAPNGCPVSFEGRTVHVVYQTGGQSSPGYEVEARDNVLTWTLPPCAAQTAGPGKMQLMVYGADSLLHSAVIPYTVLDSLEPGEGGEDPVPALVLLLDKAQAAISGANAAASTANQVAQIADTAANLASEKAGLAQNAASSANEAATNATNSAELAQTAADNANSASESANSAAGTANNAADNANSAAESANSAATNANQVADEIQQKADSGAFNGKDGLNAPQIDDTQITTTNPWSSMQIVKTLCPPFTVSGATVQCTPVANYPLDVQVEITPTQEGTGDPSPENVRPIVGWDGVNVWRSGKNLLDWSKVSASAYPAYGLSFEKKENSIRVFGVSTENGGLSFNIATTTQSELYGKNFIFSWFASEEEENVIKVYGLRTTSEKEIAITINLTKGSSYDFTIQIAVGTEKLTSYEPYQGQAYTVQLGQTVYGGTLDVGTGEGSDEWAFVEFDGSEDEQWRKQVHSSGRVYFLIDITPYGLILDPTQVTWKCNRLVPFVYNYSAIEYPEYSIGFMSLKNTCAIVLENESMLSVDEVKAWLAENPVTVCYKLATPEPFQATGSQPIPALPGTNTVYTDAGNITVTGASDPIATITALQNRVSALESAALN